MSTQIAVRLDDDQLQFIDRQVLVGAAGSRADLVRRAVGRLQREERAAAEIKDIIARDGNPYPDLDGIPSALAGTSLDID